MFEGHDGQSGSAASSPASAVRLSSKEGSMQSEEWPRAALVWMRSLEKSRGQFVHPAIEQEQPGSVAAKCVLLEPRRTEARRAYRPVRLYHKNLRPRCEGTEKLLEDAFQVSCRAAPALHP